MKTFWVLLFFFILYFFFRLIAKVLFIRKTFKDAINQQTRPRNNANDYEKEELNNSKFEIEAETIDYEIIDDNKNEK